ncbi:MAG: DUF429 domain-containing protein [Thermoplasmata archaeon]
MVWHIFGRVVKGNLFKKRFPLKSLLNTFRRIKLIDSPKFEDFIKPFIVQEDMDFLSIGIDLAWAGKNPTACAVLAGNIKSGKKTERPTNLKLSDVKLLSTDEDILSYILQAEKLSKQEKTKIIIAIDAPLVFPDEMEEIRKCEQEIRKRGIRILPVQKTFFLKKFGLLRGPELCRLLGTNGFFLSIKSKRKQIIEVYPYASWKKLLGKVPAYKHSGRASKQEAINIMIKALAKAGICEVEKILSISTIYNSYTKFLPDLLDSVMCAAIGAWHIEGSSEIAGDLKNGFIVF